MDLTKDSYYALLETESWKRFRKDFIRRKGYTCQRCGKSLKMGLQVHHLRYHEGLRPWEYEDDDMQCLCVDCHRLVHLELIDRGLKVPVYDSDGEQVSIPDELCCRQCGGSGFFKEYGYLMGGLCFRCFGTGMRFAHRYNRGEAYRYSLKIYHQWLARHEDDQGTVDSQKFTCARDVEEWLLSLNDKQ